MPLSRRKAISDPNRPVFTEPVAPDERFIAIGDIHGNLGALEGLLNTLAAGDEIPKLVCVGDYIDRGDKSAGVLSWLKKLDEDLGSAFVCIRGNHEEMLLQFMRDPETYGARWLRHGGLQTLASYKVQRDKETTERELRDALQRAMGSRLIDWLAELPLFWQSGNVAVVHAGADPQVAIEDQDRRTLQWGHPDFETVPRTDGKWVVHGHTIVDQAHAIDGRINIDTGAYATGRLTAAEISKAGVRFLSS